MSIGKTGHPDAQHQADLPEQALFNYDYCKGCGICVAECPCGSIKMVPEEI